MANLNGLGGGALTKDEHDMLAAIYNKECNPLKKVEPVELFSIVDIDVSEDNGSNWTTYQFNCCYRGKGQISSITSYIPSNADNIISHKGKEIICFIPKDATLFKQLPWSGAREKKWLWKVILDGKKYSYDGADQRIAYIPSLQEIYTHCAGYFKNQTYWTGSPGDSNGSWCVGSGGSVYPGSNSYTYCALPFITVNLPSSI